MGGSQGLGQPVEIGFLMGFHHHQKHPIPFPGGDKQIFADLRVKTQIFLFPLQHIVQRLVVIFLEVYPFFF